MYNPEYASSHIETNLDREPMPSPILLYIMEHGWYDEAEGWQSICRVGTGNLETVRALESEEWRLIHLESFIYQSEAMECEHRIRSLLNSNPVVISPAIPPLVLAPSDAAVVTAHPTRHVVNWATETATQIRRAPTYL